MNRDVTVKMRNCREKEREIRLVIKWWELGGEKKKGEVPQCVVFICPRFSSTHSLHESKTVTAKFQRMWCHNMSKDTQPRSWKSQSKGSERSWFCTQRVRRLKRRNRSLFWDLHLMRWAYGLYLARHTAFDIQTSSPSIHRSASAISNYFSFQKMSEWKRNVWRFSCSAV
jgi:hypothetical protein